MKADIDQLKNQMGQMFEMMVALKDAVAVRNEEAQSSHPPALQQGTSQTRDPNCGNRNTQEFPPYGLPLKYEPVYEGYEEQEIVLPMGNAANPKGQPEFTQIPPASYMEKVVIDRVTSNVQPRVLQVPTGETSVSKNNVNEGIQNMLINADMTKSKLEILEERLRMIEGASACEFGDVAGLCLVSDVVIPPKFKVPEFVKYKGFTCPKSHLIMYCRKMAAHAHDEKLLMHFFQDNLTRIALNWYMNLEPVRIRSWKDLVHAFIKQYKYNMDLAPNRMQLQGLFKWRELAAQVETPLHEKEIITMFIETLQSPYYEHVLGSVSSNFSDIVTIGKRIEHGLKSGKIAQNPSVVTNAKKPGFNNNNRKKEGEVQAGSAMPYWERYQQQYRPNYRPSYAYIANVVPNYQYNAPWPQTGYRPPMTTHNAYQPNPGVQNANQAQNQNFGQRNNSGEKAVKFTPLPMTYSELLPDLVKNALVVICPARTIQPPYPRFYDANAKCEYHGGEIGHST